MSAVSPSESQRAEPAASEDEGPAVIVNRLKFRSGIGQRVAGQYAREVAWALDRVEYE